MGSTSLSVTTGAADVFASLKEIRAPLKAVRSVTHIVRSFVLASVPETELYDSFFLLLCAGAEKKSFSKIGRRRSIVTRT